jgi:hypothetical protein
LGLLQKTGRLLQSISPLSLHIWLLNLSNWITNETPLSRPSRIEKLEPGEGVMKKFFDFVSEVLSIWFFIILIVAVPYGCVRCTSSAIRAGWESTQ